MRKGSGLRTVVIIVGLLLTVKFIKWLIGFVKAHQGAVLTGVVLLAVVACGVMVVWLRASAGRERHAAQLAAHIEVTDAMTGTEFEQWCAQLLRRSGLRRVQVCGGSGDRGADNAVGAPPRTLSAGSVWLSTSRWRLGVGDALAV